MEGFIKSLITMFVIMDPFISSLVFMEMSHGMSSREKSVEALTAVSVAGGLLVLFSFSGPYLLEALKIDIRSFQIAGGVILIIMGVQSVLEAAPEGSVQRPVGSKALGVIIGTPLLTGPGALMTITTLTKQFGHLIPLLASAAVLAFAWLMLRLSEQIGRLVGRRVIQVMSKLMGLLVTAIAVQYIVDAVRGYLSSS